MKGIITDDSKYVVKEEEIRCYDVDGALRLKPAAFMDLAQEMAYLAADAMHFGYEGVNALPIGLFISTPSKRGRTGRTQVCQCPSYRAIHFYIW